ncbi:MAG: hypothetical protein LC725_09505, partial [Lentisphaerae bacterium]|nr:hypothetical protein [Lentisphaerota bacterium]
MMTRIKDLFGFGEEREEVQPPLENSILPDHQRDKLERDIMILEDEYGIKEKQLHKEAERQVQDAAKDSLKQMHVIQMGRCPHCGEHLNEHVFAAICESCGWNTFDVPRRGPTRVHLADQKTVIDSERCYVSAIGDVFLVKNDVVIARLLKGSVAWIEYVWDRQELDERYKVMLERLHIFCGWCNARIDSSNEEFHLVHIAFGSTQERYVFCSDACYEAFRKMYPSRVHRNCYERKCAECDMCVKRYDDDENGSFQVIAKDLLRFKAIKKPGAG